MISFTGSQEGIFCQPHCHWAWPWTGSGEGPVRPRASESKSFSRTSALSRPCCLFLPPGTTSPELGGSGEQLGSGGGRVGREWVLGVGSVGLGGAAEGSPTAWILGIKWLSRSWLVAASSPHRPRDVSCEQSKLLWLKTTVVIPSTFNFYKNFRIRLKG